MVFSRLAVRPFCAGNGPVGVATREDAPLFVFQRFR